MVTSWVSVDTPEPVMTFKVYGRSPRLHLNADAQQVLRSWSSPESAPLRVTIVRSEQQPHLIAVGLDPYGASLDFAGYASAARFTRKLGVKLPVSITLRVEESVHLLIGELPTPERAMPLKLPPPAAEPQDLTSVRGIIHAVSVQELPAETVEHEDTSYEDDDDGDEDDGAED